MSATVLYMSVSLDGFIAGPNAGPGNGLGDGGERLHEWSFNRWLLENDLVDEINLLIVPWSSARARGYSPTPARTSRLIWSTREPSRRA